MRRGRDALKNAFQNKIKRNQGQKMAQPVKGLLWDCIHIVLDGAAVVLCSPSCPLSRWKWIEENPLKLPRQLAWSAQRWSGPLWTKVEGEDWRSSCPLQAPQACSTICMSTFTYTNMWRRYRNNHLHIKRDPAPYRAGKYEATLSSNKPEEEQQVLGTPRNFPAQTLRVEWKIGQ